MCRFLVLFICKIFNFSMKYGSVPSWVLYFNFKLFSPFPRALFACLPDALQISPFTMPGFLLSALPESNFREPLDALWPQTFPFAAQNHRGREEPRIEKTIKTKQQSRSTTLFMLQPPADSDQPPLVPFLTSFQRSLWEDFPCV